MGNEVMDLEQLASYLQRNVREVSKMASRGWLPGQKVAGNWRFHRAEINQWIESQMHAYTEQELAAVEAGPGRGADQQPLLATLLTEATLAVPLPASTRASVLKELVNLAEQSWQVYDPEAVLTAVREREELASTALEGGIAIPHPRRLPSNTLGEPVVAFGRTASGIPFGAPNRGLTDLFFLVLCADQSLHLRVLARLSRLLLRPGFSDELRAAETPAQAHQVIEAAENDLILA